jgi:hypothetical protein
MTISPGYYSNDYETRRSSGSGRLHGLLGVALGLVACWLPLSVPAATADARGFAVTSAGITALFLAASARRAGYGLLSLFGSLFGFVGTVLCLWSLASFYRTDVPIPSPPSLVIESVVSDPSATGLTETEELDRIVPPIEGADIALQPEGQLRANLRHIAFNIATGLTFSKQQGELPRKVHVSGDGVVHYNKVTLSTVPPDMVLEYKRTSSGQDFKIRVSDVVSGVAVVARSETGEVVDE